MRRKLLLTGAAVVLAAAALLGIWFGMPHPQMFSGFAMGSVFSGTLWDGCLPVPGLSDDIASEMQGLEAELLRADGPPAAIAEAAQASGGAFAPYLGALAELWNIDGNPRVPSEEEIQRALQTRQHDPGAYGKGLACDKALDLFKTMRVRGAVFNLGGNILTYGNKPWGRPFKIALRDPKGGPNDTLGLFTLRGTNFISTSGSYEKQFEQNGVRYHHIFDPETGRPAQRDPGLVSVTVISQNGAIGDALSTASFVLGYETSQALLRKYNCDALFIYEDGAVKTVGNVQEYFTR
jgi:thiamine biosynthesis lipoprotein